MSRSPARRVASAAALILAATGPLAHAADPLLSTGLIQLTSFPALTSSPTLLTSYPMTVNSPPLNGYVPQIVFGLTDQQDRNSADFAPISSSSPGGSTLPKSAAPQYQIATFDTGSQSHIINYAAYQAFNFATSGRVGSYTAEIIGASGSETVDVTDPIGVYVTSFANASASGSSLSVTPGTLKGQWNTSILAAEQGSSLPNLIGAPMAAQYQTVIRNSQTSHLTVGSTTYRSPSVTFQALDTPLPDNSYVRLTLDLASPAGVSPKPAFIPSLDNFNNFVDNPTNPTFWASFFARVNGSHTGGSIVNESFLFDTGAEVTVLSQDTAAALGYYSAGPDASTPDFTVDVAGVGGTQSVPGFFVNNLSVLTNGGYITWNHVPVLVLDVIDPRDGVGFVPGILGTNLFADRDLVINGGTTNPSVGISLRITPQWTSASSATWSNDSNWSLGCPDQPDLPANFLSAATTPQTVTLDKPTTVGSLTFDNPNRYTLTGTATLTLQSTLSSPSITVLHGSHKLDLPVAFASPATLTISPGAQLDITTNILSLTTSPVTIRQYLHDSLLISSVAQSDPLHRLALAYSVDPVTNTLTVKTAFLGDANLDGRINADDFTLIDRSFAKSLANALWQDGDFNYDGTITSADYLLLDSTYAKQQGGQLSPELLAMRQSEFGDAYVSQLLASVPEPSSVACLFAGLPFLARRRHRRADRT